MYSKREKELVNIIKKLKNKKTSGELSVQFMDFKKLYKYFKWKPKYKFEKTLPSLFNWYEEYFTNNK